MLFPAVLYLLGPWRGPLHMPLYLRIPVSFLPAELFIYQSHCSYLWRQQLPGVMSLQYCDFTGTKAPFTQPTNPKFFSLHLSLRLPPSPPCYIFQLHLSFAFSFSFHFMCPSPSLRLYEDRCSLPLTHRFPFLSHILCFSFSCLPASVHQTEACCYTQFETLFSPQSPASPQTSCMSVSLVLPKQTPFTLIRF